ncbi:MAG TPA: quinoprotein dehydrogenase-associated putative ABC transporter substrate-binding protein [Burkholderiales bacterium]|nr:quinoprotein dehydrogenase-associated putative ABC transporter substrate-binding protein [Burkholderiales bacterium]
MFSPSSKAVAALSLLAACGSALAQDSGFVMPRALRACADPNNLPFSDEKGEGFENRVAEIVARRLNLPLEYYYYPMRMNVLRNTLRYKLPGQSDYRCDVLTSVPADWDQVSATAPYYRSTYVLVYAKERKITAATEDEFLALDRTVLSQLKIGIYDRTPATRWLLKHDLVDQGVPYRLMNANPDFYPGKLVEDVAAGKIDAAIVWGPIGGFFAKRVPGVELAVLPLKSEPGVRFDYAISMGVRRGENEWRSRIQQALEASRDEIAQVLREYNVPVVDASGEIAR